MDRSSLASKKINSQRERNCRLLDRRRGGRRRRGLQPRRWRCASRGCALHALDCCGLASVSPSVGNCLRIKSGHFHGELFASLLRRRSRWLFVFFEARLLRSNRHLHPPSLQPQPYQRRKPNPYQSPPFSANLQQSSSGATPHAVGNKPDQGAARRQTVARRTPLPRCTLPRHRQPATAAARRGTIHGGASLLASATDGGRAGRAAATGPRAGGRGG